MLPPMLVRRIENQLSSGLQAKILSAEPVAGGCIHKAYKLITSAGLYFLKWNTAPLPAMFSSEAHGITHIHAVDAIKTPQVLLFSDLTTDGCPGFILMEWIESGAHHFDPALLGEQLALFHLAPAQQPTTYGLEINNYIGSTPQINAWSDDWIVFFREQRLNYQANLAIKKGYLPISRRNKLEKLLHQIDRFLTGIDRRPSLLHGDLWAGNILAGSHSEPYLIDPAVYFGDREAEIAFTELFGGFPPRFYQAYNSVWPLSPGYPERRDLYNLYHALNHLNIFGETYGPLVDGILRKYVGN
jgi:protein-ribulosamine 3-kinase